MSVKALVQQDAVIPEQSQQQMSSFYLKRPESIQSTNQNDGSFLGPAIGFQTPAGERN